MPAKGTRKIPDKQKAQIIATKRLRMSPNTEIAKKHHVALSTIDKLEYKVSPEVLAMADVETEKLLARIERVRDKALIQLEREIDKGTMPGNHLTSAFNTLYDKSRLEDGLSTSNISVQTTVNQYVQLCQSQGLIDAQIANALLEFASERGFSLNDIATKAYSQDDREQFAQLIGYSIAGFHELSYVSSETALEASRRAKELFAVEVGCRVTGCEMHGGIETTTPRTN